MKSEKTTQLDLPRLHCYACGYTWFPRRTRLPDVCPKCKSRKWNKPKPKDPTDPTNMTAAQRRLVETFLLFVERVEPTRVKGFVRMMETELKLLGQDQQDGSA